MNTLNRAVKACWVSLRRLSLSPLNAAVSAPTSNPLTIPVGAGVRGLSWKSPEWEAVYQPPRSTIESRNDLLKSARNNGLGDSTARLMRGWAAQLFHIALGVVGVNCGPISRWLRKGDNNDGWTDPTPPPDPTNLEDLSLRELADVNAPPLAA